MRKYSVLIYSAKSNRSFLIKTSLNISLHKQPLPVSFPTTLKELRSGIISQTFPRQLVLSSDKYHVGRKQAVCGLNTNRKYNVIFLLSCIFSLDKDFFPPLGYENYALIYDDTQQEAAGLVLSPYTC